MKNRIDAHIEFSYKGETYTPAASLDLDTIMESSGKLGDMHQILARLNHIDTYSYLYEVMEMHEVEYSHATGVAADCLVEGVFDRNLFEKLWNQQREMDQVMEIAQRHLAHEDLARREDVKQALLEAYRAGKASQ